MPATKNKTKARKTKKYIFTLVNINTEKIDQKYGISIVSNIYINDKPPDENITKITELAEMSNVTSSNVISFLDETKRLYQCHISMIDFNTRKETDFLKYNCYWCRHPFESKPIGCPIRYISNKGVKKYYSEVSKDNYTIKENITYNKRNILNENDLSISNNSNNSIINVEQKEFYETDGIFCSFNCCKAYIKDNKHNTLYEHSEFLLSKLYFDMIGSKNIFINPAPHWRLLTEYGGKLSINQFRDNFNKNKYEYHGILKDNDIFKPIANLYEEKINF